MKKRIALYLVALLVPAVLASTAAADELDAPASWQVLDPPSVQQQLSVWLEQQDVDAPMRQKAESLWDGEAGEMDLTERVAATIALVEPRAAKLLETCRQGATPAVQPQLAWLDDEKTSDLARNNLRLLVGRSLVQGLYFDEALQHLDKLATEDVLDPASLLFYRGVAHHRLIHKDKSIAALERLMENKDSIPRRYAVLARLMRADMSQVKDGSLDDISRHMKDVERRLGLGRTTKRVRDIEDDVIEMLDKLIEEEEKKQCQACQSAAGGAQSSKPAQDSLPLGGKGPGQVTKKDIGKSAGWGELPPKQREEAMQEIGRDFPAHYREVVEEYFRELAKQKR